MVQEKLTTEKSPQKKKKLPEPIVSLSSVASILNENQLSLKGTREILSNGAMGPIYFLKALSHQTGKNIPLVEKTFTHGGDVSTGGEPGKRFWLLDAPLADQAVEARHRLGLVNKETGKVTKIIIDWLYNENKALDELKDVPGIPKSYGAVYEGTKGSILEEYIDGFDIFQLAEEAKSAAEINAIFNKIITTYTLAAQAGFIYNSPASSTIMVRGSDKQPFLIDWYNHSTGSVDADGPLKEKFLAGLSEIEDMRQSFINEIENNNLKSVRKKLNQHVQ